MRCNACALATVSPPAVSKQIALEEAGPCRRAIRHDFDDAQPELVTRALRNSPRKRRGGSGDAEMGAPDASLGQ